MGKCNICKKIFQGSEELSDHIRDHYSEKSEEKKEQPTGEEEPTDDEFGWKIDNWRLDMSLLDDGF